MSPPPFAEFNKQINNLLNHGFFSNTVRVNVKTASETGVKFEASGTTDTISKKTLAAVTTRYEASDKSVSFVEKWDTDNVLSSNVLIKEIAAGDILLNFITTLAPGCGKHNVGLRSVFRNKHLAADTAIAFESNGAMLNGSFVGGRNGWLLGYRYSFNATKSAFLGNTLALGYDAKDFCLRTCLDRSDVTASLFHKVNSKLNTGILVRWSSRMTSPSIAFGMSYQVDPALQLKAKVDNDLRIGLSVRHELRKGIALSLSTTMDGTQLTEGGKHQFGASLEFNA